MFVRVRNQNIRYFELRLLQIVHSFQRVLYRNYLILLEVLFHIYLLLQDVESAFHTIKELTSLGNAVEHRTFQ